MLPILSVSIESAPAAIVTSNSRHTNRVDLVPTSFHDDLFDGLKRSVRGSGGAGFVLSGGIRIALLTWWSGLGWCVGCFCDRDHRTQHADKNRYATTA